MTAPHKMSVEETALMLVYGGVSITAAAEDQDLARHISRICADCGIRQSRAATELEAVRAEHRRLMESAARIIAAQQFQAVPTTVKNWMH